MTRTVIVFPILATLMIVRLRLADRSDDRVMGLVGGLISGEERWPSAKPETRPTLRHMKQKNASDALRLIMVVAIDF
jgi:hypothetical protein